MAVCMMCIDTDGGVCSFHAGKETFESGAVRSELVDVRYDLISPFGLRRLAMTYAEGAKKYDDHNWRKGMPFSVLLNHVMEHLTLYSAGENGTDHLAHAAWGLFAMMEFEETMPDMTDLYYHGEVGLDAEEEGEKVAPYVGVPFVKGRGMT